MNQPSSRFQAAIRSRYAGPILLLLLVIVANYNVVFLGQSLVASSNYHPFDYRFTHLRPGQSRPSFAWANWHDLGDAWWAWEPAGKLFSKEFRAARVPMWDPEVGGGVDTHVSVIQGQYYPPYILLLLAGDTPALEDIYYLVQVFAAGLFCYLLMRNHGCHPVSAVATGVIYMLGGSLTQNVNSNEGQTFAVLPAMVWAIDWVIRKSTWRVTGVAALILATAALASFLPIVVSGYLLVGIFVLVQFSWQAFRPEEGKKRMEWRQCLKPVSAVLVSILLIGFLLLPVQIASHQDQSFSKWYAGLGLQHYSFDQLLTLLSPSVSWDVNQTFFATKTQLFQESSDASFFYAGLIPVLLCFLGYPKGYPNLRKLYLFFLTATLFLLLKLVGMPPAQWIGYLPVFGKLHFIPYFCGALNFAIAGLAGLGVEKLIRQRSAITLSLGIMAAVAVFIAILRFAQTEPINAALQGPTLMNAVAHFCLEIARLVLLTAGFLSILALQQRSLKGVTTGLLMLTLVFLDLAPLAARGRFLRSDVWAEPPDYVKFLQSDHGVFRVHGMHDLTLTADISQAFGLQVLSSRATFNSPRFTELLRKFFAAPNLPYPIAASLLPSSRPLLDLLNVKYLLTFSPSADDQQRLTSAGLEPKFQDGRFQVFQNKTMWDRAYLATSDEVESTPEQSLDALGHIQPGEVILEQPSPVEISAGVSTGTVEAIHYDFDRITMRVTAVRPALLVLDENYSPGWHATVQGKPAGIQRANFAFQAIAVPQGNSEVEFRYLPVGLYTGVGISVLGLLLVAVMIWIPFSVTER